MRIASVLLIVMSLAMLACGTGEGQRNGGSGGGGAGGNGGDAGGSGGSSAGGAGPADLEVQPLMYMPPELPVGLLEDGDVVPLWRAPQGGHVVLIGARVRGLESDFIQLKARVRIPETGIIVSEEGRTVVMEDVEGEPGLKQTDRRTCSQVAHVALCPDYGDRDIVGQPYLLEVFVTELYANFSIGSAELTVVPSCVENAIVPDCMGAFESQRCFCECTANYTSGKCGLTRDAGTDGALDAAPD